MTYETLHSRFRIVDQTNQTPPTVPGAYTFAAEVAHNDPLPPRQQLLAMLANVSVHILAGLAMEKGFTLTDVVVDSKLTSRCEVISAPERFGAITMLGKTNVRYELEETFTIKGDVPQNQLSLLTTVMVLRRSLDFGFLEVSYRPKVKLAA